MPDFMHVSCLMSSTLGRGRSQKFREFFWTHRVVHHLLLAFFVLPKISGGFDANVWTQNVGPTKIKSINHMNTSILI